MHLQSLADKLDQVTIICSFSKYLVHFISRAKNIVILQQLYSILYAIHESKIFFRFGVKYILALDLVGLHSLLS